MERGAEADNVRYDAMLCLHCIKELESVGGSARSAQGADDWRIRVRCEGWRGCGVVVQVRQKLQRAARIPGAWRWLYSTGGARRPWSSAAAVKAC